MKSRRRVNFYEAGSGQEVMRVDWFTLLFKVTRINQRLGQLLFVASVNWCDEAHSQAPRFALKLTRELFVISISFPNLLFDHSSLSRFAQAVIGLLLLTRRLNQPKPSNRLIVSPWSSLPRLLFLRDVHLDPVATVRGTDTRQGV